MVLVEPGGCLNLTRSSKLELLELERRQSPALRSGGQTEDNLASIQAFG